MMLQVGERAVTLLQSESEETQSQVGGYPTIRSPVAAPFLNEVARRRREAVREVLDIPEGKRRYGMGRGSQGTCRWR